MIPAPFVSDDYLRARLALPFGKPLIVGSPFNKPFNRSISFGELPAVKGYFLGGLIGPSKEELRQKFLDDEEKRKNTPSIRDRIFQYGRENPDLVKALYGLYVK